MDRRQRPARAAPSRLAAAYWHWFFFQAPDLPEVMISAAPEAFLRHVFRALSFRVGAIEEPPEVPVESANVRNDFAAKMAAIRPDLRTRVDEILGMLPSSLNKGTRQNIEIALGNLAERVASNADFALDQFYEATERVTTSAKAEIDAVVTHVVQATGIDALRQMRVRGEVPVLPVHKDTEDGT